VTSLLDRFPRASLGHWPTPLERASRLPGEIWLKRDDCSGLALGGNKTRKLEFLLGAALADGCTGAVTFGALQSNHARQTAAACARLGLTCDLILVRAVDRSDEHYVRSGNLLLDELLGATVHIVDDDDEAFEVFASLFDSGRSLYGIGPGGSDPVGTLGYVAAALELAAQCSAVDLTPARVVVAASTAGTATGLILGLAAAGLDTVVDIACVYADATHTAEVVEGLLTSTAALLGVDVPANDRWKITDHTLGPGYGIPTEAGRAAISSLATAEGVLLDPVYTAKAMAHLLATPTEGPTVFLHTGGAPGLFAYAPDLPQVDLPAR
jgi:D-cysteine desulfhydrase family pyridoxal phosphate-dependent enzyme